jgi:hypothetical protein
MSRWSLFYCVALAALVLMTGFGSARAESSSEEAIAVMVDEFSYLDTSGEPSDQGAVHRMRLQAFMAALRRDVAADKHLRLVGASCVPSCTSDATVSDRLRAVSEAGAKILIVGSVQKTSTLVQWARAAAIDVSSNRLVFERLFTFRGDNDAAWEQAEAFVSREIRDALAAPPSQPKLAIFPFALEDESAGAGVIGESESDIKSLTEATEAVRQLINRSGRYRLIEAAPAAVSADVKYDCDGCDARLARELGADQSLTAVVRRISRAEYTIRFQVRDAATGAVIAAGNSGLRMGANYSWGRGAMRLVQDRLLDGGEPKP